MILELGQAASDGSGTWLDLVERGGILGAAFAFIWALLTERIVPGSVYRRAIADERARAEEWRRLADEAVLPIAEHAVRSARGR